jgi:FlaA1/EpsC-like NDP-sugar epimerase
MGTPKSKIKSKEYAEIKWILFSAVLITIFINPKFADPFNAPKMHILILSSIVLVTYLFFAGFFNFKEIARSTFTVLILIFLLILIAARLQWLHNFSATVNRRANRNNRYFMTTQPSSMRALQEASTLATAFLS